MFLSTLGAYHRVCTLYKDEFSMFLDGVNGDFSEDTMLTKCGTEWHILNSINIIDNKTLKVTYDWRGRRMSCHPIYCLQYANSMVMVNEETYWGSHDKVISLRFTLNLFLVHKKYDSANETTAVFVISIWAVKECEVVYNFFNTL